MRWFAHCVVWLALVGCSRDNPWFVLNDAGPDTASSTGSALSSSAGTTDPGASSGEPRPDTSSTSEPDGSTSTTTSTTSTSTSTTASSDASTGDTGESSGSSTGDVEEEVVLYDLYQLCPAAMWSDDLNKIVCKAAQGLPPSVAQTMAPYEAEEVNAVAMFPEQVPAGYIDGVYAVQLFGATNPRFRAVLRFPPGAKDTDKVIGQVYIESPNVPVVFQSPPILVESEGEQILDLDLAEAATVEGSLSLHLQLTVSGIQGLKSRGLWLRPRVVSIP